MTEATPEQHAQLEAKFTGGTVIELPATVVDGVVIRSLYYINYDPADPEALEDPLNIDTAEGREAAMELMRLDVSFVMGRWVALKRNHFKTEDDTPAAAIKAAWHKLVLENADE